jgi:hypothetical protein
MAYVVPPNTNRGLLPIPMRLFERSPDPLTILTFKIME